MPSRRSFSISSGAIYTALRRLEAKGFLESELGEGSTFTLYLPLKINSYSDGQISIANNGSKNFIGKKEKKNITEGL